MAPPVRVLVIDDDTAYNRCCRRLLTRESAFDYDCTPAFTGAEALALLAASSFDLAILDLGLPDISGLELLIQIRHRSAMPVVILTGDPDPELLPQSLDAQATDHVAKTVPLQELLARLRHAIRTSRPELSLELCPGLSCDFASGALRVDGSYVHLFPQESALLNRLCQYPGAIKNSSALIECLNSGSHELHHDALEAKISALRSKLGRFGHCIITHRGRGYSLDLNKNA